ncbi:MAG TPA: acetate/propionate family kinase [Steroidobacteraceae bacterium]|nr:acetate/propionate family kinase [Steroidobacteraceae bacterium]
MAKVLTINAGSSSIRFASYDVGDTATKLLGGKIDRVGLRGCTMTVDEMHQGATSRTESPVDAADHRSAAEFLLDRLGAEPWFSAVRAVGHRIVHGMQHSSPERVTPGLLGELRKIIPYDPEHLPREIELIDTISRRHPGLDQVACFDTAFHRTMPRVATVLPIPRRYASKGVQRYGFHGLSYTYLMAELGRLGDPAAARGRVILAHLGNGASLAAVRDGRCIDTSMGFTPASGLVMSTRSGDLDPGVLSYLALTESMDAAALQKMVTHASGLLGVSETSSDIRDLLAREPEDARAAEAVALFCYQIKKWIGAFAAALGGVDTLVFAGGIGENAAAVRARVCEGLQYLGIRLDDVRNAQGAPLVSAAAGPVAVRVIRTDEESVIAEATVRLLDLHPQEARP